MADILQVAMIGQPNVGKSMLFTRMTGVGVISSNYPGTTVEFDEATVTVGERTLHIHDLPGTYSLSVNSDDEKVVLNMLRDTENDVILIVADATNLEPSIVLAIEAMELGVPTVIALNKYDLASKRFDVDSDGLSRILGVPVVPVSSRTGEGVQQLLQTISDGKAKVSDYQVLYDGHTLRYVEELQGIYPELKWGIAIKLLEGLDTFNVSVPDVVLEHVSEMQNEFHKIHGEGINVHLARDRYGDAHIIVMETVKKKTSPVSKADRLSELTINPATGIPILICVLVAVFACMIVVGGFLADLIDTLYTDIVGDSLSQLGMQIGGELGKAIFSGINDSISAILGLVIPYIMVFYILLGVLEDTGYLPRAVVLLDRTMHAIGLHGNGFIPIIVGYGCNVPAILATRTVRSKRERVILCTLICMAVPCSAQLAILTGVTGKFAGYQWAILIFFLLLFLGFIVGYILNRRLPYEPSNLAMELPELQRPRIKNILSKMWMRTSDFFKLAVPLLIIGSIIIEVLIHFDLLNGLVEPMSWLTVSMLGLPAVTIVAFITGIVRKEMAYGMLVVLAEAQSMSLTEFMSPQQFIVFGVVMAIYLPCLATMAALSRELKWKSTAIIACTSIVIAVLIGTAFNMILSTFM